MDKIDELLDRGVDKIYPSREALEKVLRSGKKITLYQGFDPTGKELHIGHAVGFKKLRQFQDLGHNVIFLIGDGTGQAGDPSGKKTARDKFFTTEELRKNGKDYVMQAAKIINFSGPHAVKILYNSGWLNKLNLTDVLDIAGHFSLQQMLERDLYQERLKSGTNLSLREFLYPLLQGYDSVAMGVDLELGGSDQTFNMLAGRKLVREYLGKEKFVLTVPLLTDSKGTKIGKTEGNVIALTDEPTVFFAKIMSLGDDAIIPCFELLTDKTTTDIANMQSALKRGQNPIDLKKDLAFTLTKWLNGEENAQKAKVAFEKTFQKKLPDFTTAIPMKATLAQTIAPFTGLASISEAKRLISQKSVSVNGNTVNDPNFKLSKGQKIQIGKKIFGIITK